MSAFCRFVTEFGGGRIFGCVAPASHAEFCVGHACDRCQGKGCAFCGGQGCRGEQYKRSVEVERALEKRQARHAPAPPPTESNSLGLPCESCGAVLAFSIQDRRWVCPGCGGRKTAAFS